MLQSGAAEDVSYWGGLIAKHCSTGGVNADRNPQENMTCPPPSAVFNKHINYNKVMKFEAQKSLT